MPGLWWRQDRTSVRDHSTRGWLSREWSRGPGGMEKRGEPTSGSVWKRHCGSIRSTALTTHTRKRSKDPLQQANWRTLSSCRTISSRWTKRESRTFRSSAQWWAGLQSTRRDSRTDWLQFAAKKLSNDSLFTFCRGILESPIRQSGQIRPHKSACVGAFLYGGITTSQLGNPTDQRRFSQRYPQAYWSLSEAWEIVSFFKCVQLPATVWFWSGRRDSNP